MEEDPPIHHQEIIEEGLREEEVGLEPDLSRVKEEDVIIKMEPEDDGDHDGSLNRRGMPRRTIKKNRYIFDDMFNAGATSPRINRTPGKTPIKKTTPTSKKKQKTPVSLGKLSASKLQTSLVETPDKFNDSKFKGNKKSRVRCSSPDRTLGQRVGMKLRNLLKLPKAYRFVCYEFFYSNIDRPLFQDNDFITCMKESFPQLKKYTFSRTEWSMVRRMVGKPRRCSSSFFTEERINLERRRNVIRYLQQGKCGDQTTVKDIPSEIPIQLVVGTKVTARVRSPQDGLFTGVVDAYDTSNNTYRITFDRQGLGTQSIPDYEVLSNDTPETLNRQSFLQMFFATVPNEHTSRTSKPEVETVDANQSDKEVEGMLGDYPVELLDQVVRFKKLLKFKKNEVQQIKEMNSQAERRQLYGEPYDRAFQKKYAGHILRLEKINKDVNIVLASLTVNLKKLSVTSENMSSQLYALSPSDLQQETYIAAQEIVDTVNKKNGHKIVDDQPVVSLITDLTALVLQIKTLSHSSRSAYEVEVLNKTMADIYKKLSPNNQSVFENCIGVHMEQIKAALAGERGSLATLTKPITQTNLSK
ncbi:hypothetical protein WDU94_012653 [Cyamophila willieti]